MIWACVYLGSARPADDWRQNRQPDY